jgi:hypothetical protein
MAVLMRSELRGITTERIQPLIAQLLDQLTSFPGFIAQASGPVPGGYQVSEVWESQEAHERWVREILIPQVAQQLGLTEAPPTECLPLDWFITR